LNYQPIEMFGDTGVITAPSLMREFVERIEPADGRMVRVTVEITGPNEEIATLRAENADLRRRLAFNEQLRWQRDRIRFSDLGHEARLVGFVQACIAEERGDLAAAYQVAELEQMTGLKEKRLLKGRTELTRKGFTKPSSGGQGPGNKITVDLLIPQQTLVELERQCQRIESKYPSNGWVST
jgi:hypothetical protein